MKPKKPSKQATKQIDVTPDGKTTNEELEILQSKLIGSQYKNIGTILKVNLIANRLIAEVRIKPNVILG